MVGVSILGYKHIQSVCVYIQDILLCLILFNFFLHASAQHKQFSKWKCIPSLVSRFPTGLLKCVFISMIHQYVPFCFIFLYVYAQHKQYSKWKCIPSLVPRFPTGLLNLLWFFFLGMYLNWEWTSSFHNDIHIISNKSTINLSRSGVAKPLQPPLVKFFNPWPYFFPDQKRVVLLFQG